ncbi:hypothetical protein [Pleurocapsa sp. FMAR1]|uniref:hypothetical protein n=1 Tax=Pleurocapsa sp. FMAR1 TaxID=3040204 RepID=UPI0029C6AB3B|nr:hypothetical protein [Pleurocapsa sp. FMAR1]
MGYLQVAVCIEPLQNSLAQSRLFFGLGVPIALVFTGIVGWILDDLAMQPVRRF